MEISLTSSFQLQRYYSVRLQYYSSSMQSSIGQALYTLVSPEATGCWHLAVLLSTCSAFVPQALLMLVLAGSNKPAWIIMRFPRSF
jgi:hypothetical protein